LTKQQWQHAAHPPRHGHRGHGRRRGAPGSPVASDGPRRRQGRATWLPAGSSGASAAGGAARCRGSSRRHRRPGAAAVLKTSVETRGTHKNEESTSISTLSRFDLSRWTKVTVVGRCDSTLRSMAAPMVALCHWGELFWRGTRPAECGDRGMSSWNSYLCEELNFGGLCGEYWKRGRARA